jgi:hypothetical protein
MKDIMEGNLYLEMVEALEEVDEYHDHFGAGDKVWSDFNFVSCQLKISTLRKIRAILTKCKAGKK